MTYPSGAFVYGIYSELHDNLDRPEANSPNYSNDGVHRHTSVEGHVIYPLNTYMTKETNTVGPVMPGLLKRCICVASKTRRVML